MRLGERRESGRRPLLDNQCLEMRASISVLVPRFFTFGVFAMAGGMCSINTLSLKSNIP